jgi:hypothetical protein
MRDLDHNGGNGGGGGRRDRLTALGEAVVTLGRMYAERDVKVAETLASAFEKLVAHQRDVNELRDRLEKLEAAAKDRAP